MTRAKEYFPRDINGVGDNMYLAGIIFKMIECLIDRIFAQFRERIFHQIIGISMVMNCAPLLAVIFL